MEDASEMEERNSSVGLDGIAHHTVAATADAEEEVGDESAAVDREEEREEPADAGGRKKTLRSILGLPFQWWRQEREVSTTAYFQRLSVIVDRSKK